MFNVNTVAMYKGAAPFRHTMTIVW